MRFITLILIGLVAACDTTIPTPPPITVVITAVDDEAALADGVAQALTATAQQQVHITETVLALGGITLTPSPTPSSTPTERPQPTRFVTPTATPTPTITPTPTFLPLATTTPALSTTSTEGWLRILHAWESTEAPTIDVFVNGQRAFRGVVPGSQTTYQQIAPGAAQISVRASTSAADGDANSLPPILSTVVNIPAGGQVSLLLLNTGGTPTLTPITEEGSPITSGMARVTLVQADPLLTPSNLILPEIQRALVENLTPGQIVGPFDVPSNRDYAINVFDVRTNLFLGALPPVNLANRLSYLFVLQPPANRRAAITNLRVFTGATRLLPTDVYARFVNIAFEAGPVTVSLDGQPQFSNIPVGSITDPAPISNQGTQLTIANGQGDSLARPEFGPWTNDTSDKIILIYDSPASAVQEPVAATVFSQNPTPSAINANVRLIHALPNTIALNLEMRPVAAAQTADAPTDGATWVSVAQAPAFGTASAYTRRTPETVNAQVVLTGTRTVIAAAQNLELLAGGTYDLIAMPGNELGSAQLVLIQPNTQITSLALGEGNPAAIQEAVAATLTAAVPIITATPTRANTATPTGTPLPTNTPRPSNTPSFPPPVLLVDPAPPNTTRDSVTLVGQNFLPGRRYVVTLDDGIDIVTTGLVGDDGNFITQVPLPFDLTPGSHILRVCVACQSANAQEQFVVVRIAARNMTPTPTVQP